VALDKLTLAELERMFSEHTAHTAAKVELLPPVVRHKTGRTYLTVPGAVFFELDDLLASVAK
jgi:hypothetical protein